MKKVKNNKATIKKMEKLAQETYNQTRKEEKRLLGMIAKVKAGSIKGKKLSEKEKEDWLDFLGKDLAFIYQRLALCCDLRKSTINLTEGVKQSSLTK